MHARPAVWLLCAATVGALGLTQAPNRSTAARREPIVIGPASDPVRRAGAAKASATRFLDLYASAADGRLSAAERNAMAQVSASQVAELLVDQPPEELRSGGRLARLSLKAAADGSFAAVGTLSFRELSEVARLTVARYPDGSWRVTTFNPAVAAPNLGARH